MDFEARTPVFSAKNRDWRPQGLLWAKLCAVSKIGRAGDRSFSQWFSPERSRQRRIQVLLPVAAQKGITTARLASGIYPAILP